MDIMQEKWEIYLKLFYVSPSRYRAFHSKGHMQYKIWDHVCVDKKFQYIQVKWIIVRLNNYS